MFLLFLLLITIVKASNKIPVIDSLLYYKDSQLYTFAEAMKFCSNLGGDPPHNFSLPLINILLPTLNDYDVGYWLDAEHGRGGYRWQKSGVQILADLWEPNEPNCDSRSARLGCRVSLHPKTGHLRAHTGVDRMHALCAVNYTDPDAVAKLRSKAPSVLAVDDRIEIERILMRFEVEQETGSSSHALEKKLSLLNSKVDSVVDLLKGLMEDLQTKGVVFPVIRSQYSYMPGNLM